MTSHWTYSNSEGARVVGRSPKGEIIYSTIEFSNAPNSQLVTIDMKTKVKSIVPLHQANQGIQDKEGTCYFVPLPEFNYHIKRYKWLGASNLEIK